MDIVPTFLGAHGWAEGKSKEWYIDQLCQEMIPQVAAFHMASFNDVWVDEGNYTSAEAERILTCGVDPRPDSPPSTPTATLTSGPPRWPPR